MESLWLLAGGFATALQPANLAFAFAGCLMGTLIGVLPGIGPAAGTAMLIPVVGALDPTGSIIMLAAIYYGAMYGGTITSVLANTPGEAASAVTCIDGYAMARAGRAGPALAIAAIGSFVGGIVATIGLVVVAMPLTRLALGFGPPEIFALLAVGLAMVTALASRSAIRALVAAVLGMLVAQVGIDPVMGTARFTFGRSELYEGVSIIAVVMGLFGLGEVLANVERRAARASAPAIGSLWLTRRDARDSAGPVARGTAIGFVLGLVPGLGSMVPTFLSYAVERKLSPTPERFGTGMIQGVAGPETANNAYANAALIPLFTLGIPSSPTIAVLMGAFMVNGLVPGPALFTEHAAFAWAVIASLIVGNAMLLVLNLPLVPLWVSLLRIPYPVLACVVLAFCVIGVYSVNNSAFDVWVMLFFGAAGYGFRKLDLPVAPMVLTLVLAPLMERTLRQSLEMSGGDMSIFLERPLAACLLAAAIGVLVLSALSVLRTARADSEV
jgi:putative tricarboxylic transport membrane protein